MQKIIVGVILLLLGSGGLLAQNQTPRPVNGKKKVGWIRFDSKRDNQAFKCCDENNIQEYYQTGTHYEEGIKSIRRFFQQYPTDAFSKNLLDGYLTIRFVVNCKGETDRYRVWATDREFKPQQVQPENEQKLLEALRKMGNWQPGERDGKFYDAYAFLTFKILNGKMTDILP